MEQGYPGEIVLPCRRKSRSQVGGLAARRVAGRGNPSHLGTLAVVNGDGAGRPVGDKLHVRRPAERAGAVRVPARIVVPGRVDHRHAGLCQTAELLEQEALRAEGEALAVEQIAGDEHGVNAFGECTGHRPAERLARGLTEAVAHGRGAPGEGVSRWTSARWRKRIGRLKLRGAWGAVQ